MAQRRSRAEILRNFFISSPWAIALVPNGDEIQWAVMQQSSKGSGLHSYGQSTSLKEALDHIRGIAKDALYFTSVLPSLPILCRQITLPILPLKELQPALTDLLEQTLAIGVDNSLITYEFHPNDEGSLTVISYLARQPTIEEHLAYVKKFSLDPEFIVPKAPCLAAYMSYFKLRGWQYVIDINADETTVVLLFNGHVVESRALVGGCTAFAGLQDPSSENDEALRLILQHLTEAVLAYKERYGVDNGSWLTVTGSVLKYPLADKIIAEFVQIPLSSLHTSADDTSSLPHATAVGAACLSHPRSFSAHVPNFRNGRFSFGSSLLHWKRPLIALAVACCAIASTIIWYGASESQAIIEQMRNDWKNITLSVHVTPDDINKQTQHSIDNLHTPSKASPAQLLAQGNWLLTSMEQQSSYPLQPDIPHITDLIAWLAMQIREVITATPESNGKLEIQSLSYQLVKRPTKIHPKEHYQVRVDLEVTTPSVALARALHERLLTAHQFIATSSDIKWTSGNGKYRANFFLRDKTYYPPQEL